MSERFPSGVSGYTKGRAEIVVNFPQNSRGIADISCYQCPYFAKYDKTCKLNGSLVNYPESYVGVNCPLELVEEE